MLRKSVFVALAACLLAACGMQGKYYEQTPQAIHAALRSATLPYHVLGSMAQGSRVTRPDNNTVVTAVLGPNQSEMIRFVTTITPDGTGSRVLVEVRPPEGNNSARAAQAMKSNGFAMAMMKKLADEHVAAAIEHRPFDMMFATDPMAKGMIGANPGMQEQIDAANRGAADINQAQRDFQADSEAGGYEGE